MTDVPSLADLVARATSGPWAVAARLSPGADPNVPITGATHDSRAVRPGWLFCCVPGQQADGHHFASAAVEAGAAALLVERVLALPVPQIVVADARAALGPVAAAIHGDPSQRVDVVGVTGTNGKTTTVHLLASVLAAGGQRVEAIGTLTQARTTPEATDLQALLGAFAAGGPGVVAMEVSSHALEQRRVDATRFAVAVFTNLSQDHLDFHGTMEAYFRAKARLFEARRTGRAVVNADDPYGRLLADASEVPTTPYSLADAADLVLRPTSSAFVWRGARVELALGGSFNVANALAAATAASLLGVEPAAVAEGLRAAGPVPGRFEPVDAGQPFGVVVDYAHTPDGLARVLGAARATLEPGRRVLVVFGCGGDRDRTKRPLMGEAAARLADMAVLTSDNPRSEDPLAIIDEVRSGVERPEVLVVEADRRAAIELAIGEARPGDVVVIAGKGHEPGQEIAGVVHPFDDRQVAREALARWSA